MRKNVSITILSVSVVCFRRLARTDEKDIFIWLDSAVVRRKSIVLAIMEAQ